MHDYWLTVNTCNLTTWTYWNMLWYDISTCQQCRHALRLAVTATSQALPSIAIVKQLTVFNILGCLL